MTKLNLRKPLAVFDLEATGMNVCADRIVEISIVRYMPDGKTERYTYRVNPGIPIPAEASMVHGIYDKDIKNEPSFKELAPVINRVFEGCDLGGYNHIKFDIPMLVEEFLRAGIEFDLSDRKLIDAQKIFHLMEKRTLSAAYKFYCQKELTDAHSAEADAVATLEILQAQLVQYDGEEVVDAGGNSMGKISSDIDALHRVLNGNMVDLAGRFVYNQDNVEVFNFGKHKGKPVVEVLKAEPGYYDWMMRGEFPLDTKQQLTRIKFQSLNNAFSS